MIKNHRSKLGTFLYNLEMRWVKFLSKHMWLWWVLNLAWGILYSLIGLIIDLFVCIFILPRDKNSVSFNYRNKVRCHQFGNNWGGLEGVFFIFVSNGMGKDYEEEVRMHELGHSFQNALFGPFFIFIVAIPSAIRYWYQVIKEKKGYSFSDDWYDNAWFEGSATDGGKYYISIVDKQRSNQ